MGSKRLNEAMRYVREHYPVDSADREHSLKISEYSLLMYIAFRQPDDDWRNEPDPVCIGPVDFVREGAHLSLTSYKSACNALIEKGLIVRRTKEKVPRLGWEGLTFRTKLPLRGGEIRPVGGQNSTLKGAKSDLRGAEIRPQNTIENTNNNNNKRASAIVARVCSEPKGYQVGDEDVDKMVAHFYMTILQDQNPEALDFRIDRTVLAAKMRAKGSRTIARYLNERANDNDFMKIAPTIRFKMAMKGIGELPS